MVLCRFCAFLGVGKALSILQTITGITVVAVSLRFRQQRGALCTEILKCICFFRMCVWEHALVEVRGQLMGTNSPFSMWLQDSEPGPSLGVKCPYPLGPVQNF